jgi:hypothetical protein
MQAALLITYITCKYKCLSGCSSVVERQLPKLNVVGSIPITRSFVLTRFEPLSAASERFIKTPDQAG